VTTIIFDDKENCWWLRVRERVEEKEDGTYPIIVSRPRYTEYRRVFTPRYFESSGKWKNMTTGGMGGRRSPLSRKPFVPWLCRRWRFPEFSSWRPRTLTHTLADSIRAVYMAVTG